MARWLGLFLCIFLSNFVVSKTLRQKLSERSRMKRHRQHSPSEFNWPGVTATHFNHGLLDGQVIDWPNKNGRIIVNESEQNYRLSNVLLPSASGQKQFSEAILSKTPCKVYFMVADRPVTFKHMGLAISFPDSKGSCGNAVTYIFDGVTVTSPEHDWKLSEAKNGNYLLKARAARLDYVLGEYQKRADEGEIEDNGVYLSELKMQDAEKRFVLRSVLGDLNSSEYVKCYLIKGPHCGSAVLNWLSLPQVNLNYLFPHTGLKYNRFFKDPMHYVGKRFEVGERLEFQPK